MSASARWIAACRSGTAASSPRAGSTASGTHRCATPTGIRSGPPREERALPVNFHVGFNPDVGQLNGPRGAFSATSFVEESAQSFIANTRTLAEAICSGLLDRFPELKIVSVESGIGWVSFFLEALDWQWENNGLVRDLPRRLLPSEYFRRQVYATYWFERRTLDRDAIDFQDNLMFSTDFPHPTSQSPGPASIAVNPRDYVEATLAHLPETVARKVLRDNAARLYGLPSPLDAEQDGRGDWSPG